VHGLIYDIADGILHDLDISVENKTNRKELRLRFLPKATAAVLR
jgi:hypothetical protein